jgi:hypothetical protein
MTDPEGFIRFMAIQQERKAIVQWVKGQERFPGELQWLVIGIIDEEHLSSE